MSYRRRYLGRGGGKYSNETITFSLGQDEAVTSAGDTWPTDENPEAGDIPKGILVVPATNLMGNRKVKNFTIKVTAQNIDTAVYGALVYVPEGTTPSNLGTNSQYKSLYEPNQNVIAQFVIPPNCNRTTTTPHYLINVQAPSIINVNNRLARNLSSGDMIVLLFSNSGPLHGGDGTHVNETTGLTDAPAQIYGSVNYAIRY